MEIIYFYAILRSASNWQLALCSPVNLASKGVFSECKAPGKDFLRVLCKKSTNLTPNREIISAHHLEPPITTGRISKKFGNCDL